MPGGGNYWADASVLYLWKQGCRRKAEQDAGDGAEQAVGGSTGSVDGEKQMDASALADYFAPLKGWLDEQNKAKGYPVGW